MLYQLPKVLAAVKAGEAVWITEGERDTHALIRAGAVATTNPGGAGKWREDYSRSLAGASVVVVADRDEPGLAHAREVAESLTRHECKVRIVGAAKGKDAHDHLAAGLGLEAFEPVTEPDAPATSGRVVLAESFAAIRAERTRWLWKPRVPLGAPTLIVGGENSASPAHHRASRWACRAAPWRVTSWANPPTC